LFTFSDIPHSYWFFVGILPQNKDCILRLTNLALPLWLNCLEFRVCEEMSYEESKNIIYIFRYHPSLLIFCRYFAKNRDFILKLTSLALPLWPNCLEKSQIELQMRTKELVSLYTKNFCERLWCQKRCLHLFFFFRPNT
jgi:hypothetical protein